jgi:hypothetical protein
MKKKSNSSKGIFLSTDPSCTIFTIAIGEKVLYGNNEDYLPRELFHWFIPSQEISLEGGESKTIYGGIFVGFLNEEKTKRFPQGGMNEYGLMYDANALPAIALKENPNGSSVYTDYFLLSILWECKDVEEVIAWYKKHKWDLPIGGQIHYGDAKGNAVVISVNPKTNKLAFTMKKSNFIVSTNFNLCDKSNFYVYPCKRYDTAMQMLSEIKNEEDLTIQACADVLYSVREDSKAKTLYSNIYDPVNLDIYFNYGDKYQKQRKVSLLDVLKDESSFDKEESFLGIKGSKGYFLVKSVRIDEEFYSTKKT